MGFLILLVVLVGLVAVAIWSGRTKGPNPASADTAMSNPGGVGRDYGRLTARELAAHEELLREMEQ